ncbi:MAG: cell envelope integrity protein TolA [Alphaproteobacteria bacterium]|nr:cell envelope integrity protein TolA [Alphaproteobacteria bacterium]
MRAGISSSFLTHLVVLVLAQFGLPWTCTSPQTAANYIPVELVTAEQVAAFLQQDQVVENPPRADRRPEPPSPPPPEIVEVREPPPPPDIPEIVPEVEPEIIEPPEPPPPEVVTIPEPTPEPEIAQVPDILPDLRPEPPPRPEEVAISEETLDGIETPTEEPDVRELISDLANAEHPEAPVGDVLAAVPPQATRSEIDAIKRSIVDQVSKCWAPPLGAPNAGELSVRVRVRLNSAGGVEDVSVIDAGRMATDRYFRAAADSATRAIWNDRCNPLDLPADKFEIWEDIQFTFNPAEMLG